MFRIIFIRVMIISVSINLLLLLKISVFYKLIGTNTFIFKTFDNLVLKN